MNRYFPFLLFTLLVSIHSYAQSPPPIKISDTYEEPKNPNEVNQLEWQNQPQGLQIAICSTNERFDRGRVPEIQSLKEIRNQAWRGERVSAQMVLWSNDAFNTVLINMSEFKSAEGQVLPSNVTQVRFEKYVITDEFAEGCGHRKPEDFSASLVSDALDNVSNFIIKARETRPVWISVDVPQNAKPGLYTSTIDIKVQEGERKQFIYTLEVLPTVLPDVSEWKFHLDLWQNPYAVARYHNVKPWSDQHWNYLTPLMKRLADSGQKVITASINKRPWGGQTYDQFESMIVWKKNKDGKWSYDYQIFDQWVQFMMDLGVKKQISCYSMVPWGNELYYFDEEQNKEVKIKAEPGSSEYENVWAPFLKDFKKHLQEKDWNNITRIAMDERGPKEMKAMLDLLNKHAPEFGISFADNHKSYKKYPEVLKDLSVGFESSIDENDLIERKSKGYVSTHYVCCADPFPNVFTFSEPAEGTFIGWFTMAANYDGFLRWAYNSWVENPLQDSRFRTWPAGDTYIVYPNNTSSVRFEMLRDGIEDAEKIRILRSELSKKKMTEELRLLNTSLQKFNIKSKPDGLGDMVEEGQNLLNELAKKVG